MVAPQQCLICKEAMNEGHSVYPVLCSFCGDFNDAKRHQKVDLAGKIALVTGGRIGIGYATVLKLLRDGATVIATTRFPRTAALRYFQEEDFLEWKPRLHLYGLDFRNIPALERFTTHLKDTYDQLHILINNAAQTVRHPQEFYQPMIALEKQPFETFSEPLQTLVSSSFTEPLAEPLPLSVLRKNEALSSASRNSWMLLDDEVSIEELLEAQIINAVAPFVLNSRLKSLMKKTAGAKYIINVTSAEGLFSLPSKQPRHPHTNMAKAALNMLTVTCASEYAQYQIFINSVDPGWISFQHPSDKITRLEEQGMKPFLEVWDAVARIYDPIYLGIQEKYFCSGKLFKNYQEIPF